MGFGWLDAIKIIGALAFFIYGMKVMSEGVQRAAGAQLRTILQRVSKNKYIGTLTGFLVTGMVQSSSATTVMTVSFVNAGLFTLTESAGIIFGANIGTTITGWIVSILGFEINLSMLAIPLCAIAVPLLFVSRKKFRYWGEFLIGFSVIFISLGFLRESVPNFTENPEALNFFSQYSHSGIISSLFFLLAGIILTIVVQSSSVSITLIMVMCVNGWVDYYSGLVMVLGANIGTTLTAEIAAIIGNYDAKAAARIHSMFNIIGSFGAILALPWLANLADFIGVQLFANRPVVTDNNAIPLALSIFHTTYNVINTVIFLLLTPILIRLSKATILKKESTKFENHLNYLSSPVSYSELSIVEVMHEVKELGNMVRKMNFLVKRLTNSTDPDERKVLVAQITDIEEVSDNKNRIFGTFLAKVMIEETSSSTTSTLNKLMMACNEFENIADIYLLVVRAIEDKNEKKIWFDQFHRERINQLLDSVESLYDHTFENIINLEKNINLIAAKNIYKSIENMKHQFRKEIYALRSSDTQSIQRSLIFINIIDHIENVSKMLYSLNEFLEME